MSQEEREVRWQGEYIRIVQQGRWEFVERCKGSGAVVILAEHDGKVILVERIAEFVAERRAAGVAIDTKMLLLLAGSLLG